MEETVITYSSVLKRNLRGFSEPTTQERTPVRNSEPVGKEDLTGVHPTQDGRNNKTKKESRDTQKIRKANTISDIGKQFTCNISIADRESVKEGQWLTDNIIFYAF